MADGPRLTPDAFNYLGERARRLGLLEDRETALLFRSINPVRPHTIDHRLFGALEERVTRFAQHLRDTNPFATPRPLAATDGLCMGIEHETSLPVVASWSAVNRHTIISGSTGSGKSVYAHGALAQARRRGMRVWIADPKRDAQYLVVNDEDFLVIERDTPFNLLQPLAFLDRSLQVHVLVHCFTKTHYGGELTTQVLEIALHRAYAEHEVPCWEDVLRILGTLAPKGSTYAWTDAVRGVQQRLSRLRHRYETAFNTRACNLDLLFARSVYVPLQFQSTSDEFVFSTLAHLLFLHHQAAGIRDLDTLLLYDEGLTAWSNRPANIDQTPVLATLQVQLREMGIGMLVTTASISATHALLKSNVHNRVTLGASTPADLDELAHTFRLTTAQREYLTTRLALGQAIVQLGTDATRLVTFPDIPHNKLITNAAWEAALDRTKVLVPQRDGPLRIAPPETRRVTREDAPQPHLPLNAHAAAILDDVSTHPMTLTTPCYERVGVHYTIGDRAKQGLLKIGFLTAHKVTTGAGRGKTGSALRATPAAYASIRRKPPKGTRGGDSAQHAFLVWELSRRIPRSSIETLGCDLVIPYHAKEHEPLTQALAALAGRTIALNTGYLIALEIEVASARTTAPVNVARDAGFAFTVIATMPTGLRSVQHLASERVLVVDVLQLLDALRA